MLYENRKNWGEDYMNYIIAFLIGGTICVIVQLVMDLTKIQPGNIMVSLVCIGVVLGAAGIYEPFKEWAGAGASVPLLGFGSSLFNGVKEDIDAYGFIGTFSGGFRASSVGISGALIIGYLASLVFRPKMK